MVTEVAPKTEISDADLIKDFKRLMYAMDNCAEWKDALTYGLKPFLCRCITETVQFVTI